MYRLAIPIAAVFQLGAACFAQDISAPLPQSGTLTGTVEDVNGGAIPDATVKLDPSNTSMSRSTKSDGNGFFAFADAPSGVDHQVIVHSDGFKDWISPITSLGPGQSMEITPIKMIPMVEQTVNAILPEQLALEQVRAEEKQRVLGIIPTSMLFTTRTLSRYRRSSNFNLPSRPLLTLSRLAGSDSSRASIRPQTHLVISKARKATGRGSALRSRTDSPTS